MKWKTLLTTQTAFIYKTFHNKLEKNQHLHNQQNIYYYFKEMVAQVWIFNVIMDGTWEFNSYIPNPLQLALQ